MPISFQIRRIPSRLISSGVSGALSLIVLAVLLLSWPVVKELEKPPLKKELKRSLVDLQAPQQKLSEAVSLPKPPVRKLVETPLKPSIKPAKPTKLSRAAAEFVQSVAETRKVVEQGRTLLRLLEHGSGPSVEFAWPDGVREKTQLFDVLVRCHGMRVALLDGRDRLFTLESPPGEKWQINLDRYSTFMRQISGQSVVRERQEIDRIKRRQSGLNFAMSVRIFTRRMDAYVLGSLGDIIGSGYRRKGTVQARYKLNGQTIVVSEIVVDGLRKPGRILVPCATRRGA